MAISPKAAIEKGKALENYVADQLIAKGLDPKAARSHGSGNGNREKSDIWTSLQVLDRQAGFECKHASSWQVPEWWRQTKKLETLGYEPILVMKNTHETYDGTRVMIYLDTFLDLLVKANSNPVATVFVGDAVVDNRQKRWKLEQLIRAAKDVLRDLE